jgi:hypothetical protein
VKRLAKYENLEKKKKGANGLGFFFSKCPGLFGKKDTLDQLLMKPGIWLLGAQWGPPGKKVQKCRRRRGRWPPLPAPYTSEFFPGGPPCQKVWEKFGRPPTGGKSSKKKSGVLSFDSDLNE